MTSIQKKSFREEGSLTFMVSFSELLTDPENPQAAREDDCYIEPPSRWQLEKAGIFNKLIRGDVIANKDVCGHRTQDCYYFNGEEVVDFSGNYDDDSGEIPSDLKAPKDVPFNYWGHFNYWSQPGTLKCHPEYVDKKRIPHWHNNLVPIDFDSMTLLEEKTFDSIYVKIFSCNGTETKPILIFYEEEDVREYEEESHLQVFRPEKDSVEYVYEQHYGEKLEKLRKFCSTLNFNSYCAIGYFGM